jgi:thymidylate kinase
VVNDTLAPHRAAPREAAPLIRELCEELEAASVSYCHFKGNAFLDRVLSAEGDLDLLVRRADIDLFTAVLDRLGFKEARSPSTAVPGVSHYYGYDGQADTLVHVHAYYQLIVGDDRTQNYRLPLENALLANAVRSDLVRVPPPELELIVFVIRKTLEHLTWDTVMLGRGKLPAKSRHELALLRARADDALVERLLAEHLPSVDREVFAECLQALGPGAAAWARMRAARRLLAQLEPYSRHSRPVDVTRKLWRLSLERARRLRSKPPPRKRLVRGGAIIALVGADGAGKTTVVDGLCEWLSTEFAVTKVHLGKPAWSRATYVVSAALRARSIFLILLGRDRGARGATKAATLSALATARDRYRAYARAARFSLAGGLVICDRFPLPQLTLMDAPRIEKALGGDTPGRIAAAMSRLEQEYYRRLAPPDVLFVLRVDPEIAVGRQPSDAPDFIRSRWREIWDVDWQPLGAHVIDASRSPAHVLSEIKSRLWSEL